MTPRTLFTVVLKIIGLVLLISILDTLPGFISTLITAFWPGNWGGSADMTGIVVVVVIGLACIALYYFLIKLFLFKTDYLINKLSLDKHFAEEKIEIIGSYSSVVTIASIVIGGIIFAEAMPTFCTDVFTYIQQIHLAAYQASNPRTFYIIVNAIKMVVGYLLINNCRQIGVWAEKRQKLE